MRREFKKDYLSDLIAARKLPEMTLPEIKRLFYDQLADLYPRTEVDSFFFLLLEHYYGKRRLDLALDPGLQSQDWPMQEFESALKQLLDEKPIQYILGKTEFAGMSFTVNEDVLIPRPETEELVEWILGTVYSKQQIRILDIGTGSGCIPITLAKKLPRSEVHALDVSEKALKLARTNADFLEARVRFFQLDILKANQLDEKYDVIVSNPPYVRLSEKDQMRGNVLKYEPELALFVENEDPLVFYRKIASLGQESLNPGGILFFEINESLGEPMGEVLREGSYRKIEIRKDIYGKHRMIRAYKK